MYKCKPYSDVALIHYTPLIHEKYVRIIFKIIIYEA